MTVGFLARRTARLIVSLSVLVTAAFLMIHLVPGDPVRAALGLTASRDVVEARRESLGLNDPIPAQFGGWLRGLVTGDLGTSMVSGLPVADTIAARLPATAVLALLAFVAVLLLAVPLGLTMAVLTRGGRRRGTELGFTSGSAMLAAVPEFLLGVGLIFLFGVSLGWLPVAGRDGPESYLLPVAALALGPAVALARIVRVETLAVLGSDFVRTARAKRLPAWRVYARHAFPNALTSTATISGMLLSSLIVGTVLVEVIFTWPGLGRTFVEAILAQDYPLVQAIVLLYGAIVLVVNLLVDLLLAAIDPRSTIREA